MIDKLFFGKMAELGESCYFNTKQCVAAWLVLSGMINVMILFLIAGYKEDVGTAHAYAVVDIDDNNIYLKNPWSTDKTIAIPLDIFNEYWGIVQYTEIT